MNILKLKDVLMPETLHMAEFFNNNLKGKYAYWVQMRYIFPLDSLDYKTYIKYEQYDAVHFLGPDILPHIDLYSEECCMVDFAQVYVDITTTEKINNVLEYTIANNYASDVDIDTKMLRKFRTWLATELLKFDTSVNGDYIGTYTEKQLYMLEYYKNCMYNDVIKQLLVVNQNNIIPSNNFINSSCSCCNSNNSSANTINNIEICDPLSIYRMNMHNIMVETFSNLEFWKDKNKDFMKLFKKYIDNILKTKLIINNNKVNKSYIDCNCDYGLQTPMPIPSLDGAS